MRKRKATRYLGFTLTATALCCLSACGSSSSSTPAKDTTATKEETSSSAQNSTAETASEKEAKTADEKITLTFWDENAGEKRTPYYEELIKRFNVPPQVNFSMMGFSLDQIYALKAAAKECKLTRVTLFPCPVNGVLVPCLKMEGGDISAFCNTTGLPSLEAMNMKVNANESEQNALIQKYGVVIYSSEL